MVMALSAKNNTDFIDGFLSIIDETDPLYPHWIPCNNLVLSWILISSVSIMPFYMEILMKKYAWLYHLILQMSTK